MNTFILVIHLIVAVTLIALVLLQRSEGGGLVGGTGDFMSSRSAGNILTRLTSIFGVIFFSTSLLLAVLSSVSDSDSIVNDLNDVELIDQIEDIDLIIDFEIALRLLCKNLSDESTSPSLSMS